MRAAIFASALALSATLTAHAEELQTSPGQPFCLQMDQLQEYLLAMIKKDERWMNELDCYPIVGGAKVVIIEDYPSDTPVMHIVKVRLFSPQGQGSVVGYTLNIGIEQK